MSQIRGKNNMCVVRTLSHIKTSAHTHKYRHTNTHCVFTREDTHARPTKTQNNNHTRGGVRSAAAKRTPILLAVRTRRCVAAAVVAVFGATARRARTKSVNAEPSSVRDVNHTLTHTHTISGPTAKSRFVNLSSSNRFLLVLGWFGLIRAIHWANQGCNVTAGQRPASDRRRPGFAGAADDRRLVRWPAWKRDIS